MEKKWRMDNQINRLCRAIVEHKNTASPISYFELITMREYTTPDSGTEIREIRTATEFLDQTNVYDDAFYRIVGVYKNQSPKKTRFIGDFFDINDAKKFLYDITGETIDIISY